VAFEREVTRIFRVPTVRTTVFDSEILGALIATNSHGAVVGDEVSDPELEQLAKGAPVTPITARQNAMGNNVLANDFGALVHPELGVHAIARVGRALGVPAQPGTLAGLGTVGMAGVATNKGVVVHPRATEHEVRALEGLLKVPVHRSTANFGVPILGACVSANSRGLLVGRPTTPVEIVHLQEGFDVLD